MLEGLVKVAGQGGGAIIGAIASALFSGGSGKEGGRSRGGKKFSGLDVKRVYFGSEFPLYQNAWRLFVLAQAARFFVPKTGYVIYLKSATSLDSRR